MVLLSMGERAFFQSLHTSHWESLRLSFPLIYDFYESRAYQSISIDKKYNKIDKEYEELVFIDHHPHALEFFKQNPDILHSKTKFTFHLYGDFFLYLDKWNELLELLENKSVLFKVCSKTHQSLISSLVDKASFEIFPHLIDKDFKSIQTKNKEYDFVYCGRITAQKNIDILVKAFIQLEKEYPQARLLLIGSVDNYGYHYLGSEYIKDDQFAKRMQKLIHLSKNTDIIGHIEHRELSTYLSQARFLISPSTFHEEDFGRIVPEAVMTGCIPILTPWGGYNDFNEICKLKSDIKLKYKENSSLSVDEESLVLAMKNCIEGHRTLNQEEIKKKFLKRFSIESFKKNHQIEKHSLFGGVNIKFKEMLNRFERNYGPVFKDEKEHQKAYQCYLEQN